MKQDTIIKKSKINKKGVFAGRDFKKGEIVLKWNPKILKESEIKDLKDDQKHYLCRAEKDKYFLMQRKSDASEARLKNKHSLGIGGHIRQEDIGSKTIFDWAAREFAEEIEYNGSFEIEPIGLLNDDSNPVGQVHLGFVFLLKGDSDKIKIRSELKEGKLLTLQECKQLYPAMENWSQIVFDCLVSISLS